MLVGREEADRVNHNLLGKVAQQQDVVEEDYKFSNFVINFNFAF